jgi:hypothetical protein
MASERWAAELAVEILDKHTISAEHGKLIGDLPHVNYLVTANIGKSAKFALASMGGRK